MNRKFLTAQAKLSGDPVRYSLVVDVSCLQAQSDPLQFLDQDLLLQDYQKHLSSVAVSVQVDTLISDQALDEEMKSSDCFIGLAENNKFKKSAASDAINDPSASLQNHLDFLRYDESLAIQKDITKVVVMGVVDSGIDYTHSELSSRMWRNDAGHVGYDFVNADDDPMDDNGHGTHMAGIIAAKENNNNGGAGLNGSFVQLMAVKVLDHEGAGDAQDVYNGIIYAIENGADVINFSIESPGESALIEDAFTRAINRGVVVTGAAGNAGKELRNTDLVTPGYLGPSIKGFISVTSVDTQDNTLSGFANYSNTYIEMAAPGAYRAPYFPDGGVYSTNIGNTWSRIPGTSQASPMVASAAAILIGYLKTKNIGYTPFAIEEYIKSKGSWTSNSLKPYVVDGNILDLGELAKNIDKDFADNDSPPTNLPIFDDDGSKASCP